MDKLEGPLPGELPRAFVFHSAPWRFSAPRPALARLGFAAWALLHRLLLGADAAVVRGRGDEPGLDRGHRRRGPFGKSHDRRPQRFARDRPGPHRWRRNLGPATSSDEIGRAS